jgi:hypothetical protein
MTEKITFAAAGPFGSEENIHILLLPDDQIFFTKLE